MRIETFWIDMYSVYVVFLTNDNKRIEKMLFFPIDKIDRNEIKEIVKLKFHNVKEVIQIEEIDEGLALK